MPNLARVGIVREGLAHLTVMCLGCVSEAKRQLDPQGVRVLVRDYGPGGFCELCRAELTKDSAEL